MMKDITQYHHGVYGLLVHPPPWMWPFDITQHPEHGASQSNLNIRITWCSKATSCWIPWEDSDFLFLTGKIGSKAIPTTIFLRISRERVWKPWSYFPVYAIQTLSGGSEKPAEDHSACVLISVSSYPPPLLALSGDMSQWPPAPILT